MLVTFKIVSQFTKLQEINLSLSLEVMKDRPVKHKNAHYWLHYGTHFKDDLGEIQLKIPLADNAMILQYSY